MTLLGIDESPRLGGVVARQVIVLNVLVPNHTIEPIVVMVDGMVKSTNFVLRNELLLKFLIPSLSVISTMVEPLNAFKGISVKCEKMLANSLNFTIAESLNAVPMAFHRDTILQQAQRDQV